MIGSGSSMAHGRAAQARRVLADLPLLGASDGQHGEAVPVLPGWVSAPDPVAPTPPTAAPAARPSGGSSAPGPTDGEMNTVYRRWQAKAQRASADRVAQQQAEASGDLNAATLASRRLVISTSEEKSARKKFDQLRKRRPDWTATE